MKLMISVIDFGLLLKNQVYLLLSFSGSFFFDTLSASLFIRLRFAHVAEADVNELAIGIKYQNTIFNSPYVSSKR